MVLLEHRVEKVSFDPVVQVQRSVSYHEHRAMREGARCPGQLLNSLRELLNPVRRSAK